MKKEFNEDHTPLGYLITFRTYGTWLHADDRGSIDRHNNRYGAPLVTPNQRWLAYNKRQLKHAPVKLTRKQRALTKESIERTCDVLGWRLYKTNVRTNHVHAVVGAACGPSGVMNALKSHATRDLRERNQWSLSNSPWAGVAAKDTYGPKVICRRQWTTVELDQGDFFASVDDIE
jgi:REP element-mobilizing transposase RayT